jgi:hypothetical protein
LKRRAILRHLTTGLGLVLVMLLAAVPTSAAQAGQGAAGRSTVTFSFFPVPSPGRNGPSHEPQAITTGADGDLWFSR